MDTVYVLIEYMPQKEFTDVFGECATEAQSVIGAYSSLEKANAAKAKEEEAEREFSEEYGYETPEFIVHRMIIQ